jgi:CheY-like chemotaxis protein
MNGTTILLAEDREDDVLLIQRAFREGGVSYPIIVVRDGEEAIRYLSGLGRYSNRELFPVPTLFLLDLTLPGTDGFEVLRWIRTQPLLAELPVVVLTQSDRIRDVNQAYRLGAYSFIVKTDDFQDAVAFAQSMSEYWLRLKTASLAKMPEMNWPPKENPMPFIQQPGTPPAIPGEIISKPKTPPDLSDTVIE